MHICFLYFQVRENNERKELCSMNYLLDEPVLPVQFTMNTLCL